jgi:hypothetical protein
VETYFAYGFGALASVLLAVAVNLLRSLGKTQADQSRQLVRIETVLTGADGTNGLNGDVKALKEWRQEQDEHGLPRRVHVLEERRYGPEDRRQAI